MRGEVAFVGALGALAVVLVVGLALFVAAWAPCWLPPGLVPAYCIEAEL